MPRLTLAVSTMGFESLYEAEQYSSGKEMTPICSAVTTETNWPGEAISSGFLKQVLKNK